MVCHIYAYHLALVLKRDSIRKVRVESQYAKPTDVPGISISYSIVLASSPISRQQTLCVTLVFQAMKDGYGYGTQIQHDMDAPILIDLEKNEDMIQLEYIKKYTYIHTYIHYIHTCIHICICTCVYKMHTYTKMHVYVYKKSIHKI